MDYVIQTASGLFVRDYNGKPKITGGGSKATGFATPTEAQTYLDAQPTLKLLYGANVFERVGYGHGMITVHRVHPTPAPAP